MSGTMGDETLLLFPSLSLLCPQPNSGESSEQGKLRGIRGLALLYNICFVFVYG